jgi:hypothetical protein
MDKENLTANHSIYEYTVMQNYILYIKIFVQYIHIASKYTCDNIIISKVLTHLSK